MGTLKTSINITSTDTLPFSVNQTAKNTVPTGEFVESGTKLVQPLTSASYAAQEGLISTRDCGANGAYIFAQNPTTNITNILLFGITDVNQAVSGAAGDFSAITGLEPLATLVPGDSTLIPVPASQVGVYAHTTYGTASLQYYLADREGDFGQSGIVVTSTPTNYRYAVLDAQAGVLSQGNPTPYFTSLDTEVSSSYDYYGVTEIVNNKGYILTFYDTVNPFGRIYKFIDAKGKIAGTLTTTEGGDMTYTLDEIGGYIVAFNSGSDSVVVNHFDGETLYTHTLLGQNFSFGYSWDSCSADGAYTCTLYDYLGVSGDTATVLFNKDNHHILSVESYNSTGLYIDDAATSLYGNFIFLSEYSDNTGYYTKFQIWNTDGTLLKDLDLTDLTIEYIDYVLYGSNKLQIIATNVDNVDYLLNYNGATNHLIGHNSTNPQLPILNWSHDYSGVYDHRFFYAYGKYPTNSIRPWDYDWNSGLFDAESMAILYANNDHDQSGYHINSTVYFCDIVYVMAGATTYGVHKFANDEEKYIRIPNESEYNRITPSSNLIAFNYGAAGVGTGSLGVLAITPTGVTSSSLAPDLAQIYNGNGDIRVAPVGEYVMYRTYNPNTDKTTHTVVKSATKKATLVTTAENTDYYRRYNSLIVYDYDVDKVWYFNTTSNAFVELPNTWNWWNDIEVNRSTTTNGLNDGNQLFYPWSLETTALAKMRLLKKGTITAEKQLPVTDGNFQIKLGSEAVFLMYQDMNDDYNYKVNVYDLNLDLKKVIPLNTDNYNNFLVSGKRCYIKTYGADILLGNSNYSYYVISLTNMAYWLHADNDNMFFNDKYWWDYIN